MARVWAPCLMNKQEWEHLGWTRADSREAQWWQAAERWTDRGGLLGVAPQSRTDGHHRKLRGRQMTSPLEEGLAHSKIIQRHLTGVVTSLTQEMFLTQRLFARLPGDLIHSAGQGVKADILQFYLRTDTEALQMLFALLSSYCVCVCVCVCLTCQSSNHSWISCFDCTHCFFHWVGRDLPAFALKFPLIFISSPNQKSLWVWSSIKVLMHRDDQLKVLQSQLSFFKVEKYHCWFPFLWPGYYREGPTLLVLYREE